MSKNESVSSIENTSLKLGVPLGIGMQIVSMATQEVVVRSAERNYDTYHNLVDIFGKSFTDFTLAWADNVGGVVMALSLKKVFQGVYDRADEDARTPFNKFVCENIAEILLGIGVAHELTQALFHEGDPIDMCIMAIPLLLSIINKTNQKDEQ